MDDTTITDELKACPFCGGPAKLVRHDLDERHSYGREAYVQCLVCKAQTAGFLHDETRGYADRATADPKAITAWNTRPKETTNMQVAEAVREAAAKVADEHADQNEDTVIGRRINDTARSIARDLRALDLSTITASSTTEGDGE